MSNQYAMHRPGKVRRTTIEREWGWVGSGRSGRGLRGAERRTVEISIGSLRISHLQQQLSRVLAREYRGQQLRRLLEALNHVLLDVQPAFGGQTASALDKLVAIEKEQDALHGQCVQTRVYLVGPCSFTFV
jgi:hypothetical protein